MIQEKLQYEWNARNQITLWGPRGEIRDYAIKQWAGVVADYFKPRWEVFIREMQIALQEKRTFNKKSYSSNVFNAVEEPFTFSTKHYSDEPKGDFKKFIQFRLLHKNLGNRRSNFKSEDASREMEKDLSARN